MDTGTHVVMGFGLGGIAMFDPVVAQSPAAAEAIMFGTLIGSLAPDFDTIYKLKDNATYIRQHRGLSHSMPALLLWPLLISGVILLFFPELDGLHLWLWTFAAVVLHVFVDLFNAYGTQALRPINNKWIAFGVINIFDPVIFGSHAIGLVLWSFNLAPPSILFLCVYILLIFYYTWRIIAHRNVQERVMKKFPNAEYLNLSPTLLWTQWHLSVRTSDKYFVAQVQRNKILNYESYERKPIPDTTLMRMVKEDKNVRAFLDFSPIYRWETTEFPDYEEVRFIDLRYRNKDGHYPFVAIVLIDEKGDIASSFTGWVHSEAKLQKKLEPSTGMD
ncbi:MAG TPA: metal-dependent hydrolase [Bacillales bacterium]|nr:metal-dependent hydrolase [Bacillales bacterium]